MRTFTDVVSTALFHSLWQDAILGIVLLAALAALRHRPANARYAASCVALGLMAALPIATAVVLYLRADPAETSVRLLVTSPQSTTAAAWVAGEVSRQEWLAVVRHWAVPIWSIGVLLFSLRLLVGSAHALSLKRHGEAAEDDVLSVATRLASGIGVERFVPVLISARAHGPATIGWLRPVILLPPATLLGLTPQQLEAVLAHELAHIRRRDYLVNALQMVVETLLFYHPAVWWASRQARIERELCCDDLAVAACGDPLCYAQALTRIARSRIAAAGMAMGAASGSLVYRVERLLDTTPARPPRPYWPALLTAVLVLSSGALSTTWIRAQAQGTDTFVYSGLWEMRPTATAGTAQLRLCYAELFSRSEVPLTRLDGIALARLADGDRALRFALRREAGTFSFEGKLVDGIGTGTYTFAPADDVSEYLARSGFERPTSSLQHTLALHDIALSVVEQLTGADVARPGLERVVGRAQAEAIFEEVAARFDRTAPSAGWC